MPVVVAAVVVSAVKCVETGAGCGKVGLTWGAPSTPDRADHGWALASELGDAIDGLYAVFGRYPLPDQIEHCEHCITAEEVQALRRAPARELDADTLRLYVWNSISFTCGDLADFKHFLPHLLELLAADAFGDHALPLSMCNHIGVQWRDWPADEQAAIEAFLWAYWHAILDQFPAHLDVVDGLEAIAATGVPVEPLLRDWQARPGVAPARHLAQAIQDCAVRTYAGEQWQWALFHWLARQARQRLEDAVTAIADPDLATEATRAYPVLTQLQQHLGSFELYHDSSL